MQLIFNFRKGFTPLKEGLETCGCTVFDNLWEPSEAQLKETDACIINFYEGVRRALADMVPEDETETARHPLQGS